MAVGGIDGWVSNLGAAIDQLANNYGSALVSNLSTALVPVVSACMTLWILLTGWQILRGEIAEPIPTLAWRMFKINFIIVLALNAGVYNTTILQTYDALRDEIALFISNTATNSNSMNQFGVVSAQTVWGAIDNYQQNALGIVQYIDQHIGWTDWGAILAEFIFLIAIFFLTMVGLFIAVITKIFGTFFIGLGPIFILCLLFKPTQRLFDAWLGMVLNTIFLTMISMFVLGFALYVADSFATAIVAGESNMNTLTTSAEYAALCGVFGLVLWQAPAWASQLSGGVSVQLGGGMATSLMRTDAMLRERKRKATDDKMPNALAQASKLARLSNNTGRAAGALTRVATGVTRAAKYRLAATRGMNR